MQLSITESELNGDHGDAYESDSFSAANKHNGRSKKATTHAASSSNTNNVPAAKALPAKVKETGGGTAGKDRKHKLERNCAAASKCRRRKKEWQEDLEQKRMKLEERYNWLRGETEELIKEIAQLKDLIMAHAGCKNTNIDTWLQNEADSFVRRTSAIHGTWPAAEIGGSVSAAAPPSAVSISTDLLYHLPAADVTINDASSAPFNPDTSDPLWLDNIFN